MTTATQIDLMPFCDPQATRFALKAPWREDGFIYAADGRRLARIPDDGRAIIPNDGKPVRGKSVIESMPFPSEGWLPLPPLHPCPCKIGEQEVNCSECKGSGKCPECKGTGEMDCCECGQSTDCDECTHGKCGNCNGTGKETDFVDCECRVRFDGYQFMRSVIAPFWQVPGCSYALKRDEAFGQKSATMFFRAEGFEGIAMGFSYE